MTIKLTARQLKAVGLLAEGIPHHAIATQLGVSVRTVERWATRADIKQAVQDVQAKAIEGLGDEIFQKCRDALTKGLPKAIRRTLEGLDNADARIQLKSAELIAKWSLFYQPTAQTKAEPPGGAEETLKGYLAYLETTNGTSNGSQHK